MEARRDPELAELGPHGIVVVGAVDADGVVPLHELRRLRVLLDEGGDRATDEATQHDHAEAKLSTGELQLLYGLLRGVHGHDRGRNDAIAVGPELLGGVHVVRAAERAAMLVRRKAIVAQPGRRVDHAEVESEVVEPLVEQPGHHGRGPIERVLRGQEPEGLLANPAAPPLGQRHVERHHRRRRALGRVPSARPGGQRLLTAASVVDAGARLPVLRTRTGRSG